VRRRIKIVFIIGGLTLFFLLDELLIVFVLKGAFPKAFSISLFAFILGALGLLSFLLAWIVYRALRRRPTTGSEGLIGEKGRALSAIHEQGEAFVHGEIWKASSKEVIQEGEIIVVTEVDGLALHVRRLNP
jgi:membrane-bound serine protease (ClpP class)